MIRTFAFALVLLLVGCAESHQTDDAGPRPADGAVRDGGVRCGDDVCEVGEECCEGCGAAPVCLTAPCPASGCRPQWLDCEDAARNGESGQTCSFTTCTGEGGYCCAVATRVPPETCSSCTRGASCIDGVLEISVSCDDGCTSCSSDDECGATEFCDRPELSCSAAGVCAPRSEGCPADRPGVCGCDGITYRNECMANGQGVSIQFRGSCGVVIDCAPQDARGVGLCDAHFGYAWNGSSCVGINGCSCEGSGCASLEPDRESCMARFAVCAPD